MSQFRYLQSTTVIVDAVQASEHQFLTEGDSTFEVFPGDWIVTRDGKRGVWRADVFPQAFELVDDVFADTIPPAEDFDEDALPDADPDVLLRPQP